jgi:hypothetical protein
MLRQHLLCFLDENLKLRAPPVGGALAKESCPRHRLTRTRRRWVVAAAGKVAEMPESRARVATSRWHACCPAPLGEGGAK